MKNHPHGDRGSCYGLDLKCPSRSPRLRS
jgi:hypothetical protein